MSCDAMNRSWHDEEKYLHMGGNWNLTLRNVGVVALAAISPSLRSTSSFNFGYSAYLSVCTQQSRVPLHVHVYGLHAAHAAFFNKRINTATKMRPTSPSSLMAMDGINTMNDMSVITCSTVWRFSIARTLPYCVSHGGSMFCKLMHALKANDRHDDIASEGSSPDAHP